MARFTLPRDLYHGTGSLEALKTFEGKRASKQIKGGTHIYETTFQIREHDYLI